MQKGEGLDEVPGSKETDLGLDGGGKTVKHLGLIKGFVLLPPQVEGAQDALGQLLGQPSVLRILLEGLDLLVVNGGGGVHLDHQCGNDTHKERVNRGTRHHGYLHNPHL